MPRARKARSLGRFGQTDEKPGMIPCARGPLLDDRGDRKAAEHAVRARGLLSHRVGWTTGAST